VLDHVCVRKVFADASLPTFSLQYQTSSIERLLLFDWDRAEAKFLHSRPSDRRQKNNAE
ncbi:hypothetical protein ACUXG4_005759, partial [Cupriavidus metallidurans]